MPEKHTALIPPAAVAGPNNFAIQEASGEGYSWSTASLLTPQPECLEQGPEKAESTSEAKTHQRVDGRYMKEFNLTNMTTWSAVAAKKEDADFKILRIRNSQTVSDALDFMRQAKFYETFKQSSHWFFIVIEVSDGSKFPSKFLERLAVVFDEQKPVIIQWDLMHSKEYLVYFKPRGECAFTPLPMNSVSLFSTEDKLTDELSKQGSFHLPLLLNALNLGIGGQFKGAVLDLLNVSFDVKWEIDTWRLIDYAARDDDSLSLLFLLLFDWDLAHQNGGQQRTLEIAAEFGGPQSISALLNMPITSSAEQLTLSDENKNLLALENVNGDNPLLIAAQKKNPDTLKFLIRCNIDLHCHRTKAAKDTAIWLAWDKKCFENMRVLLEADSPFPVDFDLGAIEENENTATFLKQVEERKSFHQAIKEGSQDTVKAFIESHPRLKRAYDPSNCSALMTALEAHQYEVYALLESEGLSAGKNEELSVVKERLNSEERKRLSKANSKYIAKQVDSHIKFLESKSEMIFGHNNRSYFGTVLELYKKLDTIPEISTILKVVEQSDLREIIIDIGRDSIADIEPTQTYNTRGVCKYIQGRLYVSGREESQLLGTLAHELTHLAMHVCYDNHCNPYEEADEERKSDFDAVVSHYREKKGMDSIIEKAFGKEKSKWPSELIVRVPHMLAQYKEEQGKQLLTQQAPKLFQFYKQHIQEDLRHFIKNPAYFKARHQIQHLNTLLGKMFEIEQSKIWLNEECLLNDDVINCQTMQILSSPLPQLTILNLYQVLRRKQLSVSDIKSSYIFVSAEQFRNPGNAGDIYKAFQSGAHPTLIIDCSYEYEKSEKDLWSTINSFSEKRRIIFIVVSDVAQSLKSKLKKYNTTEINYNWSNLACSSQNALLENTVHFQGSKMSLNQLIPANSKLTKFLPLADLLGTKTLEIGEPVMTSAFHSFDARYCTGRTFIHQVTIKHEIFEQTSDALATAEHRFIQICQNNAKSNVRWLLEDQSGKFIWQQSRRSLRARLGYTDARTPLPYPPENLDKFLEQAQYQKVMLIADIAGMGKTTVLTHLSQQIKQKFPTHWVVKIDLTNHTKVLEVQAEGKQKLQAVEFLSEKLVELKTPLGKDLFKQWLIGLEKTTKMVLMFDGVDEISPNYKEIVMDLLQALNPIQQPSIEQMWVTTRPHLKGELEETLQTLSYTLEPFSEGNQVTFLSNVWFKKSQGLNEQRLKIYAEELIKELTQLICDREKQVTGIPLHLHTLAEAFHKEAGIFCLSPKSAPEVRRDLCLVSLYKKFITDKLSIFNGKGKIATDQQSETCTENISIARNHQKLAFKTVFPELQDTLIKLEASKLLSCEKISRYGILQYVDDKPCFIHHSFAEYYVAEFLVEKFTKKSYVLSELHLFHQILMQAEFQVIRLFMDGFLSKSEPSKVNLEQYGKQIYKMWTVENVNSKWTVNQNQLTRVELRTMFYQAAKEGNFHIIKFLLVSLKAAGHTDTIKDLLYWAEEMHLNLDDLLFTKDVNGHTARHITAGMDTKKFKDTVGLG